MTALLFAAATGALGGWLAWHHPVAPVALVIAFAAAALAAAARPRLWLMVLPALIPALSFAPWTGAFAVEEIDILALAFATGGYAHVAWLRFLPARKAVAAPRRARVSVVVVCIVGLFALSIAIALGRGIMDAGGAEWSWYDGYFEALNSVRIGKGFALALLLAPLLLVAMRQAGERAVERLAFGYAVGTGIAALTVVWERIAFTGLLNFSSDYRATGMFWEMHVGGAALDGFLALGVPFVAWAFMHAPGRKSVAATVLALLVSYACLATFSRGVYLAVPISLAVLFLLLSPAGSGTASQRLLLAAKGGLAIVATAGASYFVFRAGGYRTVLAVLGVLAIALRISNVVRGATFLEWIMAAGLGTTMGVVGAIAASTGGKGPYVLYALAFATCVGLMLLPRRIETMAWRTPVSLAVLGWLMFAAGHVALHWGGDAARQDVAFVLLALLLLVLWRTRSTTPPWPDRLREQGVVVASAAVIAGSVAVMLGGAYMGDRFATSGQDFEGRIKHWRDGLGLLATPADVWLGKGLGRYPKSYYFAAPDAAMPGSHRIAVEDGNGHLVLSGPRHLFSFGELFRVAQRVPVVPGPHALTFDARAATPSRLHIEICEQHLLYNGACAFPAPRLRVRGEAWQRYTVALDGANLSAGSWYAPRLAFFSFAVEEHGLRVDIDNVALVGPDGRNLLDNGDFGRGMARWFIVSEKIHLPWHIKNLPLNVLFDQGAIGLLLFAFMVGGALFRLVAGRARLHPMAPFLAAALVGFLVVGAFDSLLDVPRVALAFYLVLFAGLALREPERSASARTS